MQLTTPIKLITPSNATISIHLNISLFEYLNIFISKIEKGEILTEKSNVFSESTIRGYKQLKQHYQEFIEWLKVQDQNRENLKESRSFDFTPAQISPAFTKSFHNYLVKETDLVKNSIGSIIKKLKSIMNYAFNDGLAIWNGSGYKVSMERSSQTYLSKVEMQKLNLEKLTKSEKRILDIILIQAFTGMRNSALQKFLKNPFAYVHEFQGNTYIRIDENKTDKESVAPLGDIVKNILKKYNGEIKMPSQQYINRTIKVVCEKAGLTNSLVVRKTIKGKTTEELVPKYKRISTHTARRTLVTLMMEEGFQSNEIMPITGHATEQQLNTYAKLSNVTKIKHIIGHDFFNSSI